MITGFNTDVDYNGEVFHVQTEDKGVNNAIVESLIYKSGEILSTCRTAYTQFLENGYDKKTTFKFMEDQHRRIIEEIRQGRFDETRENLSNNTSVNDESLDQVILNYLATNKKGNR